MYFSHGWISFLLITSLVSVPTGMSCIQGPSGSSDASLSVNAGSGDPGIPTGHIEFARIDSNCTYYATFQSHNQKVVQNENGIFLSYLVDYEDNAPWLGTWNLARSTNGGKTFQTIYRSPRVGSKAPCLENDENSDILAICGDESDPKRPLLLFKFSADRNYSNPEIFRINFAASGKYSMDFDMGTGKLFVFNHYGKLFIINATDGNLIRRRRVVEIEGANATTQYPHTFLDQGGTLHHAWTTQKKGEYLYWDIHYIRSPDEGETWYRADGTPLSTPIEPDDTGRSTQIILQDEFEYHTWLSNMIIKDGKAHFAYLAQKPEPRQHYVRIDLETGATDMRIQPTWGGENISVRGLDGFFAAGPGNTPLYYVGMVGWHEIGALVSHDNGATWRDLGRSPELSNSIYAIGGFREVTEDDFVIGSFTNQYGSRGDPYFFRVKVREFSKTELAISIPIIIILSLYLFSHAPRPGVNA